MQVQVKNQVELDKAIKDGNTPVLIADVTFDITHATSVVCSDSSQPRVVCSDSSQPRVECYDSSQPRVVCSDSSQPRVECYGSSQPRVECYGSSQPRVECYGSSQPRVECSDSSQPRVVCSGSSQPRVECYGSSQPRVECYGYAQLSSVGAVSITAKSTNQITVEGPAKIKGGKVIKIKRPKTGVEWCSFYGAEVKNGVAILFKAVNGTFKANHNGFDYTPGTKPEAPDWDGGKAECGGGLHFCARPSHALQFNREATKFVACPVRVKDIVVHKNAQSPNKIKAPKVCAPIWECDISGERIG